MNHFKKKDGVRFHAESDTPIVEPSQGTLGFGTPNVLDKRSLDFMCNSAGIRQAKAIVAGVNRELLNLFAITSYPQWVQNIIVEGKSLVIADRFELFPANSKKGRTFDPTEQAGNAIGFRDLARMRGRSHFRNKE